MAEATMGRGLGSGEEVWWRQTNLGLIHICMKKTHQISVCSYLYLKLVKMPFFIIIFFFSSTKLENKQAE
jgi:hypothetical protein